jgi:hypothetical protein
LNVKTKEINIYNEVHGRAAVSAEDGEKIFIKIKEALSKEIKVILNFINIEILTSAFLNTAIGQLYKDFPSDFLRDFVKASNLLPEDKDILKAVLERANEYYNNPDYRKSLEDTLREEFDDE